ncbi:uncharacterized protein LOC128276815, partial [Anopheles cruzii]|uniref:uncharacterized protein LOC128276815 n=1 Tax=Anopheles cruzii TaxID=68878 RepID=UPI0022EC783B
MENETNNDDAQIYEAKQSNQRPFQCNRRQIQSIQRQYQHSQGCENIKYGNQRSFVSRYETHQKCATTPNASAFLSQQEVEKNRQAEWEAKFKCKWNEEQIRWQRNLERLRRLEEDRIRLVEEQRRIEAINETRRREEENKRSEEEARQKFEENEEKERKEQEETDCQIRKMIEELLNDKNKEKDISITDLQEQNEDQEAEDYRSFTNSYSNEESATNKLCRKSTRGKTVDAVRELPIISPTTKVKRKNRKRSNKSDTYDESKAAKRRATATHSDELVKMTQEAKPALIAAIVKEDKAETIECISKRQQGRKEATGALTTVYEIKKNDDLNLEGVEAGDQPSKQTEKLDRDSFLLCLANIRQPQKQPQQQPLPRSQQPSEMHITDEKEH